MISFIYSKILHGNHTMLKSITVASVFILTLSSFAYCQNIPEYTDAEQGNAAAQSSIGKYYLDHYQTEGNLQKAHHWLDLAIAQGNASAMRHKGLTYYWPRGVEQDNKKAIQWFKKSSALGDGTSAFLLSWIYRTGEGVEKNSTEAQKRLDIAIQNGDSEVWFNVAKLYYDNAEHDGIDQNFDMAFDWFLKSADQGHAAAQFALSRMYTYAEGRHQDLETAHNWLQKSAAGGDVRAIHALAIFHRKGLQVDKNLKMALHYYQLAAEQYKKDGNYQMAWQELLTYGQLQKNTSDIIGAAKSYQEALTYMDKSDKEFGETHMECAAYLSLIGQHQEALQHGLVGFDSFPENIDLETQRILQIFLGIFHGNTENTEEAIRLLKASLPFNYEDWDEYAVLATSNIATLYANMEDYDSVMSILQTNELKHFDTSEFEEIPFILFQNKTPLKVSAKIPPFYLQLLNITQTYLEISKAENSLSFHAKALSILAMLADHFSNLGDIHLALSVYESIHHEATIYKDKEDPEWSYLQLISGIDINYIRIDIFTLALKVKKNDIALLYINTFLEDMHERAVRKAEPLSYIEILETIGNELKENGMQEEANKKFRTAALKRAELATKKAITH